MKYQAVRGMKDILPDEIGRWQQVKAVAREYFARYGYLEVSQPILEKTDLFVRGIGETTDVVEKEMYTLTDISGDSLTMRPEATAQLCRGYVENKIYAQPGGWKVYTIGPMFRHERPQKGRLRQFHQIDCECIGLDDPQVDAEMIALLVGFLDRVGVSGTKVKVNSLGCPNCRPAYRQQLIDFVSHRRDELCPDCNRRLDKNPLRVLDCKVAGCKAVVDGAPAAIDHLCDDCRTNFEAVRQGLDALEVNYEIDNRLVRGLDYYVKTTFEVVSDRLGGQDAVAGGGRYDGLVAELGGPDHGGTGFAIGLERLLIVSDLPQPDQRPDLYLAPIGPEARAAAFKLAQALRQVDRPGGGLKVVLEPEDKSLKAQLRRANKLAARQVLIVGQSELESGRAGLKNMADGEQIEIPLAPLDETVKIIIEQIQ